jgi:ATP-binding cassette subfamily F protein 3
MVRKSRDAKHAAPALEEHPGGGHITVTAQQSRYALDAVDAPASKEVHIYTFSLHTSPHTNTPRS